MKFNHNAFILDEVLSHIEKMAKDNKSVAIGKRPKSLKKRYNKRRKESDEEDSNNDGGSGFD